MDLRSCRGDRADQRGYCRNCWNQTPSAETLAAGKVLFEHEFTVNDPLCGDGDGLGPVFNEKSCVACHFMGGVGGAGTNEFNAVGFEAFPVPGRSEIVSGGIHMFATNSAFEEHARLLEDRFPPIPFAVEVVNGCATSTQSRDFDPVQIDEVNTPPLFGLGLIEKISSASIAMHGARRSLGKVSREFEGEFGGTGIGRVRVRSGNRVGRFGWKGQFATVEEFVANACAMELGLTNPKVAQPIPRLYQPDSDAKLDMTKKQLYELVSFVKSLPAPQQILPKDPRRREAAILGEELFVSIGCAECHVPNMGGVEGVYSDFHLYEVEHEEDFDEYVEPDFDPEFTLPFEHPRPSEWKTPPLWGVADSQPYFHDGQSPTLEAAIKRHGRDGRFSREQFLQLNGPEQHAVIEFLRSLRAPQMPESAE